MTTAQINELAQQSHSFLPQAADKSHMTFLSLAPTTSSPYIPKPEKPVAEYHLSGFLTLAPVVSESYPRCRQQSVSHLTRPLPLTPGPHPEPEISPSLGSVSVASSVMSMPKTRRSSSMSSDGSTGSKSRFRFLKLGPVHWGEHQGEHKEDWHELDDEISLP